MSATSSAGGVSVTIGGDASPLVQACAKANAATNTFAQKLQNLAGATHNVEMAAADAQVRLEAFNKSMDKGSLESLNGTINALGLLSAGLAAAGTFSAKAASDFEQTGGLIKRTFGESASDVEAFAQSLSSNLGVSIQETRTGLASIGAQLKQQLGDTAAAEAQSKAIVQLAADVSAAQNTDFEDTLKRMQSGLRGETESIENLNIFIGESMLKHEALAMGIGKSVEKMSEQEKTALRLSAIFRQTADLTGAAASEAGTFAGQTARLQGELKNLNIEMGQILLPFALRVAEALRGLVHWFRELSPSTKETIVQVLAFTAALAGALFAVGKLAQGIVAAKAVWATASLLMAEAGLSLAAVLGVVAASVAVFVVAYTGASALLEATGQRTVPKNVSVLGEFANAIDMAAFSFTGLLRVLINIASALASVGAAFIKWSTLGLIDLQPTIDGLNDSAQSFLDVEEAADLAAAQMDKLTTDDLAAIQAVEGLTGAHTDLKGALEGSGVPLAGTAEAMAFLKAQEKDAAKEAKVLNKTLLEQVGFLTELEDKLAGLESAAPKILNVQLELEATTREANKKTSGDERGVALALAHDIFVKQLGAALADADTAGFAEQLLVAQETAVAVGVAFQDVIDASPALAARLNDPKNRSADEVDKARVAKDTATTDLVAFMADLREQLSVSTVNEDFAALSAVLKTTRETMDEAASKALEAGIAGDEAVGLARAAGEKNLAATLSSISSVDRFNEALAFAEAHASELGINFANVVAQVKQTPTTLSDALSGRVSDVVDSISDALGLAITDGDQNSIVDTISDALAKLLETGELDFGAISKAIGQLFGASKGGGDALSSLFDLGGGGATEGLASAAASGGAEALAAGGAAGAGGVAASGAGVAAGGAATAAGAAGAASAVPTGGVGAIVGVAIAAAIVAGIPVISEGAEKVSAAMSAAAEAVPAFVSSLATAAADLAGDDRLSKATTAAFNPAMHGAIALGAVLLAAAALAAAAFATYLTIVAAFWTAVLAVLAIPLAILALVVGGVVVVFGAVLIPTLIFLVAVVVVVAMAFATVAAVIATVVGTFVALIAIISTAMAVFVFLASLSTATESFKRFQDGMAAVVDRVVLVLEPFWQHMLALVGLFDALMNVMTPFAAAFADSEQVARVIFEVVKVAALVIGTLLYALAILASAFLALVYVVANGGALLIEGLAGIVNPIGWVLAGALAMLLDGLRMFLSGIGVLGGDLATSLEDAAANLRDAGEAGVADDLAASLRGVADAADAMSPDVVAVGDALAALAGLTYDEAQARGEELSRTKELNEELTNVPAGYKVALSRFRAASPDATAGGMRASTASASDNGGTRNVFIEKVEVAATSWRDFIDEAMREADMQELMQTGGLGRRLNPRGG